MAKTAADALSETSLPIGVATQFCAAAILERLGCDDPSARAITLRQLVRSLPDDKRQSFALRLIGDLLSVARHLLGVDTIAEVVLSDGTAPSSKRKSLISWIQVLAPLIDYPRDDDDDAQDRLQSDDVLYALHALEWGEVEPIFSPYDAATDPDIARALTEAFSIPAPAAARQRWSKQARSAKPREARHDRACPDRGGAALDWLPI